MIARWPTGRPGPRPAGSGRARPATARRRPARARGARASAGDPVGDVVGVALELAAGLLAVVLVHEPTRYPCAGRLPDGMTTDPSAPEPGDDPDVVPSGDPDPIPTPDLPEPTDPGEDPGVPPERAGDRAARRPAPLGCDSPRRTRHVSRVDASRSSGTIPTGDRLQRTVCKQLFAVVAWPSWTPPRSPRPAAAEGADPPGAAADAGHAAHRGAGHRDHAGAAARPQHRRDVVPPAPAGPARLHRRRRGARQRPRPLVAGGARVDPDRRLERSPSRRTSEALDAYLQTVVVVYTQMLQQAIEERPTLPEEWRNASTLSRLGVPAQPRAGRAADRGGLEA